MTSKKTKSGMTESINRMPSSPLGASVTSWPAGSRRARRISRFSGSSSTIRIFAIGTLLSSRLRLSAQPENDFGYDLFGQTGFGDIVIATGSFRFKLITHQGVRGVSNNGRTRQGRFLADPFGHFPPVQLRHGQIQEKNRGFLRMDLFQRLFPIRGQQDMVAG